MQVKVLSGCVHCENCQQFHIEGTDSAVCSNPPESLVKLAKAGHINAATLSQAFELIEGAVESALTSLLEEAKKLGLNLTAKQKKDEKAVAAAVAEAKAKAEVDGATQTTAQQASGDGQQTE